MNNKETQKELRLLIYHLMVAERNGFVPDTYMRYVGCSVLDITTHINKLFKSVYENPLTSDLAKNVRKQIELVFKENPSLTQYRISNESGVNYATLSRIRQGEKTTDATLVKLGTWIEENNY